jgi:hypothetical protein
VPSERLSSERLRIEQQQAPAERGPGPLSTPGGKQLGGELPQLV